MHYATAHTQQWVAQRYFGEQRSYVLPDGGRGHSELMVRAHVTVSEEGATLPGASGSPLFGSRGHVHGVLSAGLGCSGTTTYYQSLVDAWEGGGTLGTSLRYWLDPEGLGVLSIDGAYAGSEDAGHRPAVEIGARDDARAQSAGAGAADRWLILLLAAASLRHSGRAFPAALPRWRRLHDRCRRVVRSAP